MHCSIISPILRSRPHLIVTIVTALYLLLYLDIPRKLFPPAAAAAAASTGVVVVVVVVVVAVVVVVVVVINEL